MNSVLNTHIPNRFIYLTEALFESYTENIVYVWFTDIQILSGAILFRDDNH